MVSLMLRMCRHVYGSGKAIFLDSEFFVAKVITELETKGVYVAALTKKRYYCLKGVPGDIIDTHFDDKEVSDVRIL